MPSIGKMYMWLVALLVAACSLIVHAQQDDSWEEDFQSTHPPGKAMFASTCAGCHGLDGRGSERAPNIASSSKVLHLPDAQITKIISNGVPGTGMPAFHALSPAQLRSLVSYIHVLQGKPEAHRLPGNATQGKEVFFGKGGCSSCHTISGKGGFLGPDLTTYGASMSAGEILKGLTNSNRIVPAGYKTAVVTTRDGARIEGVVRNEDNFSVQMLTRDGNSHFFEKTDVQKLDYATEPLMPTDYGKRLARGELYDLISFLMSAGASPKAASNFATHNKPAQ